MVAVVTVVVSVCVVVVVVSVCVVAVMVFVSVVVVVAVVSVAVVTVVLGFMAGSKAAHWVLVQSKIACSLGTSGNCCAVASVSSRAPA